MVMMKLNERIYYLLEKYKEPFSKKEGDFLEEIDDDILSYV